MQPAAVALQQAAGQQDPAGQVVCHRQWMQLRSGDVRQRQGKPCLIPVHTQFEVPIKDPDNTFIIYARHLSTRCSTYTYPLTLGAGFLRLKFFKLTLGLTNRVTNGLDDGHPRLLRSGGDAQMLLKTYFAALSMPFCTLKAMQPCGAANFRHQRLSLTGRWA